MFQLILFLPQCAAIFFDKQKLETFQKLLEQNLDFCRSVQLFLLNCGKKVKSNKNILILNKKYFTNFGLKKFSKSENSENHDFCRSVQK